MVEYYKAIIDILATYQTDIFNQVTKNNDLPKEMLEAIIITIPKTGKDPASPKNYRPISLLNSDLNIFSKILANCLLDVTPYLIEPDQVGLVKCRQGPDSTRRMINLINYV